MERRQRIRVQAGDRFSADHSTEADENLVFLLHVPEHADLETELVLPDDDEGALLALEILEAAVDNARSLVELRQSRRLRADLR